MDSREAGKNETLILPKHDMDAEPCRLCFCKGWKPIPPQGQERESSQRGIRARLSSRDWSAFRSLPTIEMRRMDMSNTRNDGKQLANSQQQELVKHGRRAFSLRSNVALVLGIYLSLALVAGAPVSALAQSSGTWTTTGSLNIARCAHTATLQIGRASCRERV